MFGLPYSESTESALGDCPAGSASGCGVLIEDGPPAEVLAAMHEAAELLDDLAARELDLHFVKDAEDGSLRVEVHKLGERWEHVIPLDVLAMLIPPVLMSQPTIE